MNIILTGATGFVGKNLLKKLSLKSNYKILCLSRSKKINNFKKNVIFIKCDLTNIKKQENKIINFRPDILVHLAWDQIPNFNLKNSKHNEKISKKLINFLCTKTNIKKIIVTGSCFEIKRPNESYKYFANAKKKILLYLKEKSIKHKLNYNWLRIFYVYGPGQREKAIIPYIISCLKKNKIAQIKEPNQRHDFIFIDDVCNAIIYTIKNLKESGVFDIGSGKITSIKKILTFFKKISENKKFFFILNNKNKKNPSIKANIKKMKPSLSWSVKTDISKGLIKTYRSL